ncbi:MAG: penicillin-binding protein 2 [Firmicutes bacterium]|nr:penicillin-binding protein 2 [Bacillota bacterium]
MPQRRFFILHLFFSLSFGILAGRLFWWQWVKADDLAARACRQRLAVLAVLGRPRGEFIDRHGRPITDRMMGTRYGPRPLAVHLIGYVNPGDGRGAAGLEEIYDDLLCRGPGRVMAAVVDARREPLRGLGRRLLRLPLTETAAVRLTIDRQLQEKVEAIADRRLQKGAIVVLAAHTGEILAMTSRPCFDPEHPGDYLNRKDAPFLNRALTAYPPGSLFKLTVLAAALEERPAAFWDLYEDEGTVAVGASLFRCPEGSHGLITLADALAFSCNTTFIHLGLGLGAERLLRMAERLGCGVPATADLAGEDPGDLPAAGNVPPAELANLSIGQGRLRISPLQMARLVAAVANGGYLPTLRTVLGLEDGRGRLKAFPFPPPRRVLREETTRYIRAMMAGVVRYGTGRAAALPCGVAGKTGTAQTGRRDRDGRSLTHAWFAGFAPVKDPHYVAVVFLEDGGAGGTAAAPVFREVMAATVALDPLGTGTATVDGT